MRKQKPYCLVLFGIMLLTILCAPSVSAETEVRLSLGQTVYVPIYSNIYSGPKSSPVQLDSVLSIRNTDPASAITITAVDYYDSEGKLIKHYLTEKVQLNAMASVRHIVPVYDERGGSGANFLVKWRSKKKVNVPIIEAIMTGHKGISFISRGQVIREGDGL